MRRSFTSTFLALVIALLVCLTSNCSKQTFKPGQKLSGRYNSVVMESSESYLFKDDGTFEHTGFGKDGKGSEKGTYNISGETVTFNVGGKTTSSNILAAKGDAAKTSPEELYIDVETYRLSPDGKPKIAAETSQPKTSSKYPLLPGYEKFGPDQVGNYAQTGSFSIPKSSNEEDAYLESADFNYESSGDKVHLKIKKYPSEAEAQAITSKMAAAAVPTEEYDKKVKLPKCDPNKETDYDTPQELVKSIPRSSGGDAYVLHSSRHWDWDCKVTSNRDEFVVWANGPYVFEIDASPPDIHSNAYGKGEAFFNDYQKAVEGK